MFWLRVFGRIVAALALVFVFVTACVAGVWLHLDLPQARAVAARAGMQALAPLLMGRVEIVSLEHLSLSKVRIGKATLYDVHGGRVLTISGVDVGLDPVRLVQELRADSELFNLVLQPVNAERAECEIVADPLDGDPTIAEAFATRPSANPSAPPGTGRDVQVALPQIRIATGHLRVKLRGVPTIDADLRDVHGSLSAGPSGFTAEVTRFDTTARGAGTEARGRGTLNARLPGGLSASFDGHVGDIELHAKMRGEKGRLELTGDAPAASPEAIRRFLPAWPIEKEPVSAHVEANGDLPALRVSGKLATGPSAVTFQGPLILGKAPRATLAFTGEHLDARSFIGGAPHTDVALKGDVAVESENDAVVANVRAHASESELEGYPAPAFDVEATIRDGAAKGTADIHEPGLPTHATFRVDKNGELEVDADAKAVDFRRVRPLSNQRIAGHGGARLRARLAGGDLTASLEVASDELEVASMRAHDARLSVQARGPIAEPEKLRGTAHVTAASLKTGETTLENVEGDVTGNLAAATVDAKARLGGATQVALGGILSLSGHPLLRNAELSLKRGHFLAEGEIVYFDPGHEKLDIRNLRVTGAGAPLTGSVRIDRDQVDVEAEAADLDLGALSRALALRGVPFEGRARVSLGFTTRRDGARGHLRIDAGDLTIGAFKGISSKISANLDAGLLMGEASGSLERLGDFSASWNMKLSGSALELTSYRDATGTAELRLKDVELGRFAGLLPKNGPVEGLDGKAVLKLGLMRASTRALLPSMEVTSVTRGLTVVLRGTDEERGQRIAGVDVEAAGGFDGESGTTSGTVRLLDSHGEILSIGAGVGIDVARLAREPEVALARLSSAPIDIRATAPMRPIADLPEGLRIAGVNGEIGGHLGVQGTFARPEVRADVDCRGIVVRKSSSPTDLHAEAHLAPDGALSGRAAAKLADAQVANAVIEGTLPGGNLSAFRGDIRLALDGLPLDLAGVSSNDAVRGRVFGTTTFSTRDGVGGALLADLRIADAAIDGAALGKGKIHVATKNQTVEASVGFSSGRGSFETDWKAGLKWNGLVPSFADGVPVNGRLVAKNFGVAAASPLVSGVLSSVGGRVDANVAVTLTPKHDDKHGVSFRGNVNGSAVLREGTAIVDVLGADVQGITMSVRADGKGNSTHISSVDIRGNLRGPGDNLRGSADLDLEGLKLVRGGGALYANDTPLFFQGAPQGRITGEATIRMKREPERMLLNVEVPKLELKLPETSSRKVLDVPDHPEIAILQDAAPIEPDESALPVSILVHFGNAVSLRRSDVELKVAGTPGIHLGKETRMSGSIELVPGGRLPVLGQVFVIERGLITFDTGVPDNPAVHVTASWRAPNNTLVFVEVTGRFKEVQVALRSEPPLPEREVFALLLGGASADPGASDRYTGEEGSAAKAVALQSSLQQLNGLLGQSAVEIRVGSTSEARPRYTAAVKVRENLWFEASTYQQSEYANDSSSYRNVVSGTVDYRFTRKWSLRMEAGTTGGALDLLWQHRY